MMAGARRPSLAVAILTKDEEVNLPPALASVRGWADEVLVLDSGSTDRTVEIAQAAGCRVEMHSFENYGRQRNVALDLLRDRAEWVLFLDADEWVPEPLRQEIDRTLSAGTPHDGFYLCRKLIWRGQWIRRGYYPTWILRLARVRGTRCEDRAVNEHLLVPGSTGRLRADFIHEDRKGVGDWTEKHNRYAQREAEYMLRAAEEGARQIPARFFGSQPERVRWLRTRVWNRMPPLVRPFFYFGYRYFLRGGILDGSGGFTYHVLHAFWYPLLTDLKYLELRERNSS